MCPVGSSPFVGPVRDRKGSVSSDPLGRGLDDLDFPIDQTIDLGLMDEIGDTSLSAPSGRGFEIPADAGDMMDIDMGDLGQSVDQLQAHYPSLISRPFLPDDGPQVQREVTPNTAGVQGTPLRSALKRRKGDEEESLTDVERELEEQPKKKRVQKQKKRVSFDDVSATVRNIRRGTAHCRIWKWTKMMREHRTTCRLWRRTRQLRQYELKRRPWKVMPRK
jgi:hypothetical protein